MINKKQAVKNNQNDRTPSAQLWQTISEEEQNALKGGWPNLKFPYSTYKIGDSNSQ
jgi:hypothetical protein